MEIIGDLAVKAWFETGRLLWLLGGLAVYCLALILFARLLRRAELAVIFALWVGIAAVLVAVLGWVVLDEPISMRRLAGLALVVCGIVLLGG